MARRCLLLVGASSYRTEAFVAAARRLGAEVVLGSDRCHRLAEVYADEAYARLGGYAGSVALDYRDPAEGARRVVELHRREPFDAVVATDDRTAVVAALAQRELGMPGNAPEAAETARNKDRMRRALAGAAVRCPVHRVFEVDEPPARVARAVAETDGLGFPCVVKPLLLSASRGVIRADDARSLEAALGRVAAILRSRPEFHDAIDPGARRILVERFVPGREVALEGLLVPPPGPETSADQGAGGLRTLAIFDKPDPLDGPLFEETIYLTPSRLPSPVIRAVERATQAAARAMGLRLGPVHAELRIDEERPEDPWVIEVAARSIGGLCARTLRFALCGRPDEAEGEGDHEADPGGHALEEIVLRQALSPDGGAALEGLLRLEGAAGVMMIPCPGEGILKAITGVDEAARVPLVEEVAITARVGEHLVPLPEASSYPGFVFARGAHPAEVEDALREAHARLRFQLAAPLSGRSS